MSARTHIRLDHRVTYCGVINKEHCTIGSRHFQESVTNPAIAGQLQLLPEPLCSACEDRARWVYKMDVFYE